MMAPGLESFMLTVIISPIVACFLPFAPITPIQLALLAPVLSATIQYRTHYYHGTILFYISNNLQRFSFRKSWSRQLLPCPYLCLILFIMALNFSKLLINLLYFTCFVILGNFYNNCFLHFIAYYDYLLIAFFLQFYFPIFG